MPIWTNVDRSALCMHCNNWVIPLSLNIAADLKRIKKKNIQTETEVCRYVVSIYQYCFNYFFCDVIFCFKSRFGALTQLDWKTNIQYYSIRSLRLKLNINHEIHPILNRRSARHIRRAVVSTSAAASPVKNSIIFKYISDLTPAVSDCQRHAAEYVYVHT